MRNLSIKLDTQLVKEFVDTTAKHGPDVIKTALISQFDPATAIALQGVDVLLAHEPTKAAPARSRKRRIVRAHLQPATHVLGKK